MWLKKKEIKSPEERTTQVCCAGSRKQILEVQNHGLPKSDSQSSPGLVQAEHPSRPPDGVCLKVRHVLKSFASSTLNTLQHAPMDRRSLHAWALQRLVGASELLWLVWGTKRLGCHFKRSGLGFFILALISSLIGREMLGEIRISDSFATGFGRCHLTTPEPFLALTKVLWLKQLDKSLLLKHP